MSPLNTPTTRRAVADFDVKAAHPRAHYWEVFLVLRRHAGQHHRATTARTARTHRRPVDLTDVGRLPTASLPTVVRTGTLARSSAATLRPVLRERCCLSEACPPRRVELFLEAFAAALPLVPVALNARQFLAQSGDLAFLFLNARIAGVLLGRRPSPGHRSVMPYPRK